MARYRIYVHLDVCIAAHVPLSLRQTNNTVELLAAIRALHIFTFGKIAICRDIRVCFSRSYRSGTTVAAKRLVREQRPGVECTSMGSPSPNT